MQIMVPCETRLYVCVCGCEEGLHIKLHDASARKLCRGGRQGFETPHSRGSEIVTCGARASLPSAAIAATTIAPLYATCQSNPALPQYNGTT
jgi:hypothetical protein